MLLNLQTFITLFTPLMVKKIDKENKTLFELREVALDKANSSCSDLEEENNKVCRLVLHLDQFRFLANCPPTPPLSQHFAVCEK